jgi:hypothetical protein
MKGYLGKILLKDLIPRFGNPENAICGFIPIIISIEMRGTGVAG